MKSKLHYSSKCAASLTHNCSKMALSNRNITSATYVILSFLVGTLQKHKKKGEITFNNIL